MELHCGRVLHSWLNTLCFAVLLCVAMSSYANDELTTENIVSEAQSLELIDKVSDTTSDPLSIIEEVKPIFEQARENQWQSSYLRARTLELIALINLERLDEAEVLMAELLELAKQLDDSTVLLRLEVAQTTIKVFVGDIDGLKEIFGNLLERIKQLEDYNLAGSLFLEVGHSQSIIGLLVEAIDSYNLAFAAFQKVGNELTLATVYSSLGNVNGELGDFEAAIDNFAKAENVISKLGEKFEYSILLYNFGSLYVKHGDFELAREKLTRARDISIEIKDDVGAAWAVKRLADIEIEEENWQVAIEFYLSVLPLFEESKNSIMQFDINLALVTAYIKVDDLSASQNAVLRAEEMLQTLDSQQLTEDFNLTASEFHASSKDYEKAYTLLKEAYRIAYDRFVSTSLKDAEKYRVELGTALKEQENKSLTLQNELNSATLARKDAENRVWIALAFLTLCVLLAVMFFLRQQNKKRQFFKTLAMMDDLTRAPNRRAIIGFAEQKLEQNNNEANCLAVALVDFDHFKQINDTHGHKVGDDVLKAFSMACKSSLRKHDKYGRFGGEEWLLVLEHTEQESLNDIFLRLRDSWNEACKKLTKMDLQCTFSMGVASYNNDGNVENLIKRADENLYKAKEQGRNQFVV